MRKEEDGKEAKEEDEEVEDDAHQHHQRRAIIAAAAPPPPPLTTATTIRARGGARYMLAVWAVMPLWGRGGLVLQAHMTSCIVMCIIGIISGLELLSLCKCRKCVQMLTNT